MMQLRGYLRGILGLEAPPFASLMLMVLLCCLGLMDACETLALKSDRLLQVHRLLTYPLCPAEPALLLPDLLLFLLLGWWQEQCLGTLRYLYLALLNTLTSASLYLLLTRLWIPLPSSACGYTTIHLALMAAPRRQPPALQWGLLRRIPGPALPWLLLLFISLLFPASPFLLHLSGVISGLAHSAGILSRLQITERHVEKLEKHPVCRALAGVPFLHFILSPKRGGILPDVDPTAGARSVEMLDPLAQTSLQSSFPAMQGHALSSVTGLSQTAAGTESPYPSIHPAAQFPNLYSAPIDWASPSGHLAAPFADLADPVMDEVLLRAGIQASLEEFNLAAPSELKLSRSSVSSLRLQQLEKMGFPTEQAVVALAATGKVEGAVSLLVGGQVGDEILVTAEGRPRPTTCGTQSTSPFSAD